MSQVLPPVSVAPTFLLDSAVPLPNLGLQVGMAAGGGDCTPSTYSLLGVPSGCQAVLPQVGRDTLGVGVLTRRGSSQI